MPIRHKAWDKTYELIGHLEQCNHRGQDLLHVGVGLITCLDELINEREIGMGATRGWDYKVKSLNELIDEGQSSLRKLRKTLKKWELK